MLSCFYKDTFCSQTSKHSRLMIQSILNWGMAMAVFILFNYLMIHMLRAKALLYHKTGEMCTSPKVHVWEYRSSWSVYVAGKLGLPSSPGVTQGKEGLISPEKHHPHFPLHMYALSGSHLTTSKSHRDEPPFSSAKEEADLVTCQSK
jgi:hypothetical protein